MYRHDKHNMEADALSRIPGASLMDLSSQTFCLFDQLKDLNQVHPELVSIHHGLLTDSASYPDYRLEMGCSSLRDDLFYHQTRPSISICFTSFTLHHWEDLRVLQGPFTDYLPISFGKVCSMMSRFSSLLAQLVNR